MSNCINKRNLPFVYRKSHWTRSLYVVKIKNLFTGLLQIAENTPPFMYLERNWQIRDTEPVGSRIAQVHGSDAEGGNLTYGLEPIQFFGFNKLLNNGLTVCTFS